MENCLIWNRQDDAATVQKSELGVNGVITGTPTYGPVFHQGGAYSANTGNYITYTRVIPQTSGCIEFWWKSNFNPGGGTHYSLFGAQNAGATKKLLFYHNFAAGFTFDMNAGATTFSVADGVVGFTGIGDIFHFKIPWDAAKGIAGMYSAALYVNGVLRGGTVQNIAAGDMAFLNVCKGLTTYGHWYAQSWIDNLKYWDYPNTNCADRYIEGFGGARSRTTYDIPPLPDPVPVHEVLSCDRVKPQVWVMGQDIYALGYVKNIINIEEYKTFRRDKVISNSYSLTVKNYNDFFSINNPVSIFKNTNWKYSSLRIVDEDSEEIWSGVIERIKRNHENKTAQLITRNSLTKVMNTKIEYASTDWETAAEAAKNILNNYSYADYNNASFNTSISQLDNNSCYIKADFSKDDDITLQQAIEKLAEASCCDCYSHKGDIYFKHWVPFTGGVKVELTESDLLSAPIVDDLGHQMINDYRIGYEGDQETPAEDANLGNIGSVSRSKFDVHSMREFEGGGNNQIMFQDATSAQYIGEQYIRRSHISLDKAEVRPPDVIEFRISIKHRDWVDLETFFRLTLSDEGWDRQLFEIFRFRRDYDRQEISIIAYEVEE
jgi:hypothetical protein